MAIQPPRCKNLVLDAGPLLSLSPLRGLAETYLTVPQVLAELKDNRAREHFERLGLISGVNIEIKSPDSASLSHVIQWAKKTGDYAVLSHPDLCVLALTYMLHEQAKKARETMVEKLESEQDSPSAAQNGAVPAAEVVIEDQGDASVERSTETTESNEDHYLGEGEGGALSDSQEQEIQEEAVTGEQLEPLDVGLHAVEDNTSTSPPRTERPLPQAPPGPIYDDPSDSDDGEGEWITPSNVGLHKSRALDLLPDSNSAKGRHQAKDEAFDTGCMTADFAMQNVLLQMGLSLVGVEGKRIDRVKSWVLRCHACFKICRDSSKKFCPSCGNPSLLRASVTVAAPGASPNAPAMQIHLKPNFQYKTRGTKYPIPAPKPGSAKKGPGGDLIFREDQIEYVRAKKRADGKREREEAKMLKGILGRGVEGNMGAASVGSWMDPDWVPEIISAGTGGKGRTVKSAMMDGDMPQIGYGKKNPNEKRRR